MTICKLCRFLVNVTMPVQPHLLWVYSEIGVNLFHGDIGSADVYGVSYVAVKTASHEDLLTCGAMKWPTHSDVFKNQICLLRDAVFVYSCLTTL